MQLKELYSLGKENLRQNAIESPDLEAYLLLSESEVVSAFSDIYTNPEKEVDQNSYKKFQDLVERRLNREPISYITGEKEFYSRSYKVNSGVLIPRPETELLVDEALLLANQEDSPQILDMGTGSGCISVTLAYLCGNAKIVATDISLKALKLAKENITRHEKQDNISLLGGDLLAFFKDRSFDIVISNPPYISESEIKMLEPDVRDYEPMVALSAGEDGLKYIKKIISGSKRILKNDGWCVLEIGQGQADKVTNLFLESGFTEVCTKKDLNGIDRVIRAKWKK